ncbi:hypothetical protein BJV82DRAFT_606681 [Fennellomyces sp. T-0311]|nr:hypothetical protein BJV82DRAFT_606681 [Fennellomyces sp. T-0311]
MSHGDVVLAYRKSIFHPPPQQAPTPPADNSSNSTEFGWGSEPSWSTAIQHTSPTSQAPPQPLSPAMTPRSRSESRDSNVQYAPSTHKFENVKSQAMFLWRSGVDLELQSTPVPKKKPITWLTESEFQNLTNAPPAQPSELRIQTTTSSKSFAEAVVSPGWTPEDEPDQEPPPFVTRPSAPPAALGVGNVAANDRNADLRMYQELYAAQSNLLGHDTLAMFFEKMDYYLNQSPRMSERTFAMLVDALVSVAIQEKRVTGDHRRVFNRMIPKLAIFLQALEGYISVYTLTPKEMIPILEWSYMFASACPRSASRIPLDLICRCYGAIKHVFRRAEALRCQTLISDIQTCHRGNDWKADDTQWLSKPKPNDEIDWWKTIAHLPSFPNGQDLFDQMLRRPNPDSSLARCINMFQNHPGLHVYLLTQYILLWEELCGPIQRGIQRFMAHDFTSAAADDGCSMYINLSVFGTTFLPTFNQPVMIFDALAGNYAPAPREGSLAVLIAEDSRASKTVLTGVVAFGATVLKGAPTLIIGVHMNDNWVGIDASKRYTLLASGTNASAALPALKWFQSNYERPGEHPPALASRLLSPKKQIESNQDMPDYLEQMELDLSCITKQPKKVYLGVKGQGAKWPKHADSELSLAPSLRRPLYDLSPSQVSAVQHALTHSVSVISGGQGTGKTFLATKLIQLLHQALVSGQCHQPILVITKNESTMDDILGRVLQHVPQLVRLGKEIHGTSALVARQALVAASPATNDPNRNNVLGSERRLAILQGQLTALWQYRRHVAEGDVFTMITTIPPDYVAALEQGYAERTGSRVESGRYALPEIFNYWMGSNEPNSDCPEFSNTYNAIHSTTLRETGKNIPPILDQKNFCERRAWIEKRTPKVPPISDATQWPFKSSEDARPVRSAMRNAWITTPKEHLWSISPTQRLELRQRVIDSLLKIVDGHIHALLSQQMHAAQVVEEARLEKWASACRFSRVIGVTADFASAHAKVIESLWPRIVLIDEAHLILESIVAPFVLASRVEHLIMMGDANARQRPKVFNPTVRQDPKNFDVSLFDRWKLAGGFINKLEEQWRMCPDIANIHDALPDADRGTLLITAPMAGENKCDALPLIGMDHRAYFIDYHVPSPSTGLDHKVSSHINTNVKVDDADEARFVARLAMYLYQQKHKPAHIAILTLARLQKVLIQHAIKEMARSSFTTTAICVETVENYVGRENEMIVLSLAMPCGRAVPENVISLSLSRARSALYIVGRIPTLVGTVWNKLAQYMKDRKLCGPEIKLHCQKHPDRITMVGNCKDFEDVKNGGCMELCNTLLNCGHVCTEPCHHLKHLEANCMQQCERLRRCAHKCPNKCFQCRHKCPDCVEIVEIKRPCGHTISGPCHQIDQLSKTTECTESVEHTLPCGHARVIKCHEAKGEITCDDEIEVTLDCGHTVKTQCCYKPVCPERCPGRLECGHSCPEQCGTDHQTHQRAVCTASCSKQLICGHYCTKGCANPDEHTDRCLEQCQYVCSHGYRCGRDCWQVCNECIQPCPYSCAHLTCTKKCSERCDRPPCNKRCDKKLTCGHPCIGLCGEPCPPCKECDPDHKCSISLRSLDEFEDDEAVYMLPECGCVFAVDSLDLYFQTQAKNGEHTAIKLWQCPSCQKPIYTALRYNLFIKTEIGLVNQIKEQQEVARQNISQKEKTDIIQAMNEETKTSINNIVGGRWFACENGHPYFIGDCGGATQISKCPHCGTVIGGLQHKVVESNRFYGEFDGSLEPAWPGQPQ